MPRVNGNEQDHSSERVEKCAQEKLKTSLTEPALLEMDGNPTNQDLAKAGQRRYRDSRISHRAMPTATAHSHSSFSLVLVHQEVLESCRHLLHFSAAPSAVNTPRRTRWSVVPSQRRSTHPCTHTCAADASTAEPRSCWRTGQTHTLTWFSDRRVRVRDVRRVHTAEQCSSPRATTKEKVGRLC
jgi:hypothetical protein